jgi:hypothetical protein
VLDREVLVAHVGALAVGGLSTSRRARSMVGSAPPKPGAAGQLGGDALAHHGRLHAHPGQDGPGDAVGLVEHGGQQVVGVTSALWAARARSAAAEGLLGLQGPAVRD